MANGKVILVAEDEETDVFFLRRALHKAGLHNQLVVARHGQEAIEYLSGEPPFADRARHPLPALVLLDLKMPVKSGFDVLAWRSTRPELKCLPMVVLTSSGLQADREKALRLGASEYRIKPRAVEDLVKLVGELNSRWLETPPASKGEPQYQNLSTV